MIVNKFIFISILSVILVSWKPTAFISSVGNINSTEISFKEANFKVLGSYTGTYTTKRNLINIKGNEGLVSNAKADLLKNAAKDDVTLKAGARTLSNVVIDVVENRKRVTCTIAAEIVEFVK